MVLLVLDYILFSGLVVGSALIGVYYTWCKKSRTVNEYIIGDGDQAWIYPTILSIVITFTSPKQMLADPTEVVMFGTQLGFIVILGYLVGCAIFIFFFLPVLVSLTGRSLFEYFERRHCKTVRMASLLPVLIFLPSLVVHKILGASVLYSSIVLTLLCLFYTTLGGVRAVIWTDTLQTGYYFVTVVFCLFFGIYQIGGFSKVLQDNLDGDRIDLFYFGERLFLDRTNIGGVVAATGYSLSIGLSNQAFYQRLVGIKGKANPTKIVILSYFGTTLSRVGGVFTGMVVYSFFRDCQPLLTKEISRPDEIVVHFIKKLAETIPGLLGLFSAGVVAAALSTMSTFLNTIACSVLDDFVSPLVSRPLSQKSSFLIMHSVVFVIGILSLAVTPLYKNVQSFEQLIVTINAVIIGPLIGAMISSMTNPWVTSQGVLTGTAAGLAVLIWMFISSQRLFAEGKLIYYSKLLTTLDCDNPRFGSNFTKILKTGFGGPGTKVFMDFNDIISKFSAVSFNWYLAIGILVTFVVSAIVSLLTGGLNTSGVDPELIIPQLRWLLPKRVPHEDEDEAESVPLKDTSSTMTPIVDNDHRKEDATEKIG
ncbi:hypothetical protein GE061_011752 [Apolygus lucorum]|uniref:Sodium/solute symporter n=1 Tax=Apolygus lucorum TaxID=248454 RepID=A0A6A4KBL5_APOLU|nr:hypothetical protein GE061_011752 [Apolygus lucorum]